MSSTSTERVQYSTKGSFAENFFTYISKKRMGKGKSERKEEKGSRRACKTKARNVMEKGEEKEVK